MASETPSTLHLLAAHRVAMSAEEERIAVEAVAALLAVVCPGHSGIVDAAGESRSHPSSPAVPAKREGGGDEPHQADHHGSAEG